MNDAPRPTASAKALISGSGSPFLGFGGLAILLLAAGLAWRIGRYALNFPMWGDESYVMASLYTRSFADMLRPPLEEAQIAPLGFMWAELAIVKTLGISEWVLRLPAFVCGLAAFLLFWPLARRLIGARAALLAVGILAASYYPVRHSAELKPYAGDMLAGVVMTALAWRVSHRPQSVGRWAALILAGAAAVWFSYPAAFVVGGMAVYLVWTLARKHPRAAVTGLAALAVVAGGNFLAMVRLYAGPQAAACTGYFTEAQWTSGFPPLNWRLPWWLLDIHAGNMMAYPFGGPNFASSATLLLVAAGCVRLCRRGRSDLVLLLLGPLIVTFLAATLRKYPYGTSARTMLFMAPGFCLLAAVGLRWFIEAVIPRRLRRRRRRALTATAVVLASAAVIGLAVDIVAPYKSLLCQQTRSHLRELASRAAPADQWVVANTPYEGWRTSDGSTPPALGGRNRQVFRYYVQRFAPAPTLWAPPPSALQRPAGTIRLLVYAVPDFDSTLPQRKQWQNAYVQAMIARFGPPRRTDYTLACEDHGVAHPLLTVYEFPPTAR